MASRKSLADVEKLSAEMSSAMRKMLRIPRRVAGTTLRDCLCMTSVDELRAVLHRLIKGAHRRKAIDPVGLAFGVIAMDGKGTAIKAWDERYSQRHVNEETHHAYGLARTITVSLTSAQAKPCIDVLPVPPAKPTAHWSCKPKNTTCFGSRTKRSASHASIRAHSA